MDKTSLNQIAITVLSRFTVRLDLPVDLALSDLVNPMILSYIMDENFHLNTLSIILIGNSCSLSQLEVILGNFSRFDGLSIP